MQYEGQRALRFRKDTYFQLLSERAEMVEGTLDCNAFQTSTVESRQYQSGTAVVDADCLAAFVTTLMSVLDTCVCHRDTARTPFQILLSECDDAHPCR
jgi:hypothetical protein